MTKQKVDANSMAINTEMVRTANTQAQAGVRMEDSASQMKPMMMDSQSNTAMVRVNNAGVQKSVQENSAGTSCNILKPEDELLKSAMNQMPDEITCLKC